MEDLEDSSRLACRDCGAPNDADAEYCKRCGRRLTTGEADRGSGTALAGRSALVAGIAGAVIVLSIAIIVLALRPFFHSAPTATGSTVAPPADGSSSLVLGPRAKEIERRILNNEALAESDLLGLGSSELRILRNVHFARYGRRYDRPGLGDYFGTCAWYRPNDGYSDAVLTPTDKANVQIILAAETRAQTASAGGAGESSAPSSAPGPPAGASVGASRAAEPAPSGGQLTRDGAQRAVERLLAGFMLGGTVSVAGIREFPARNEAVADVLLSRFHCFENQVHLPVSTVEARRQRSAPPDRALGRTPEFMLPHEVTYDRRVRAYFVHYNDGRWVLQSVAFDALGQGVSGAVVVH
jgi:hypothetical protein